MHENEIARIVVDAAFHVHVRLGPGLLESVYLTVLAYELQKRGLIVIKEKPISFLYDDLVLDEGFRVDLMVEGKVLVELKSVEKVHPVHKKQLLTYLRLTDCKLGLLINFGEELIKDGITRVLNGVLDATR